MRASTVAEQYWGPCLIDGRWCTAHESYVKPTRENCEYIVDMIDYAEWLLSGN